jgi:hypothetical protein
MGVPLKTEQRRSHTTVFSVRQPVRRAETFRGGYMHDRLSKRLGRLAARLCYRAFACSSRILFVFCFERDPHAWNQRV